MRPLRKVWRHGKPELVEMQEIKAGDLFQIQKRDDQDEVNEHELHLALGDSMPIIPRTEESGTHTVFAGIVLAQPFPLGEAEK